MMVYFEIPEIVIQNEVENYKLGTSPCKNAAKIIVI